MQKMPQKAGYNPDTNPNPNLNVVGDLRNKETLNSFSYVHAVRPFRNSKQ